MAEKKMTDWHRKVLCNFDNAWSATQDMREQIIEAQRFVRVSGAQWEGSTNAGYSFDEGRFEHYPRFELNKIARECDRIIGEYRQNRISVKFRPKDDKASEALAEKMNGKFRADYQETSGGEACDNAFDDAVTGGFGCFRIYMDNMAKSMRRAGVVWLSMAREVYGSDTPMRIVNEDGSDDVALMTGEVVDRQTGQVIALNDLSQGNYEVTVDVGQSFATRRDATVKSLLSMLALIPPGTPKHDLVSSMILDNMDGEGMDDLKEYNRNQLLLSGVIKPRTPEEQQMVEQAKQQQASQPDPAMVAAQGQLLAGQAELQKAQNEQAAIQVKAFQAQTDAQVAAANVVKILASADSQQKSDIREALKLLGQFQQQQGDNARADAELVLKSQAQGHAQRMDISSILQKSTRQQPQQ
ncbi:TPA: hypothetical protein JLT21_000250 [Escherichia coli]|nr:hypothetical protein [Escherichia coli]